MTTGLDNAAIKEFVLNILVNNPYLQRFLSTYNVLTSVVLALATVYTIVLTAIQISKLAGAGDNPQKRSAAITGLAIASISLAMLGGVDIVYMFLLSVIVV